MKTPYIFLLAISIYYCSIINSIAQTNCWQNGDMLTYNQIDWGDGSLAAGVLLSANFNSQYPNDLTVGIENSLTLTLPGAVFTFLPALGTPGSLTGDVVDPQTTSAGSLAGEVVALKLNIDFSDANILPGTIPFGDLIIYGIESTPQLNGQSVREVLASLEIILGGGTGTYGSSTANAIAALLNSSFANGIPSQFAQDHLKKGWSDGDIITYSQTAWGDDPSLNTLLTNNFLDVYSNFFVIGSIEAGSFSMTFTNAMHLTSYLPATGTPSALNANLVNPLQSSSGQFGGEVAALKINISFNDNHLTGNTANARFGDLILNNMTNSSLNGLTLRQLLDLSMTLLSGGTNNFTISELNSSLVEINSSFEGGVPSQFAQAHLNSAWGDMLTFTQSGFNVSSPTFNSTIYNSVYASTFGVVEIGIPGTAGFSMRFGNTLSIQNYLVATGMAAPLTIDLINPTSSASGVFGGNALALTLNIDFSDAGKMRDESDVPLGDLVLQNFENDLLSLNGLTIRQFNDLVNIAIGGGASNYTISDLNAIAFQITAAFDGATPSEWAQLHIVNPCEVIPANSASVFISPTPTCDTTINTPVGTLITFTVQASDADSGDVVSLNANNLPAGASMNTALPASGNPVSSLFSWTPASAGSTTITFTATDTSNEQTTCSITINAVACPDQGAWKNNTNSWPLTATPMLLGTISYNKSQLIIILNTPVGNGNKADASLILAHKLIAAKLNIAGGVVASTEILDSIASADALIGANIIPMKIKPNTTLGQRMVAIALLLDNFNNGMFTSGCDALRLSQINEYQTAGEFMLEQNIPNPFTENTSITYQLPYETHVRLAVYNQLGQQVAVLMDGIQTEGTKTVNLNANNLPAGFYFCRMQAGDFYETVKLILMK